jgi:homoserine O-acetyltransferase
VSASLSLSEACSIVHLPFEFALERSGALEGAQLGYELFGPADAPLVVALGGISAGRHASRSARDPSPGWWPDFVGEGAPIDTGRWRVLSFDWLGGAGASSGPANWGAQERFPIVSAGDQARALALLLDHLRVERVEALVGASYGGMVALAFAALCPERARCMLVISAAHRSDPLSTAWRSLQRAIVALGAQHGCEEAALAIARGLAMTSYRTRAEFAQRFGAAPSEVGGVPRFPVEDYLESRGRAWAANVPAAVHTGLSLSIDLFRVDPRALRVPATIVGVRSDALVPIEHVRELARTLAAPCELVELDSLYGHDAFLKELETIGSTIARALGGSRGGGTDGQVRP